MTMTKERLEEYADMIARPTAHLVTSETVSAVDLWFIEHGAELVAAARELESVKAYHPSTMDVLLLKNAKAHIAKMQSELDAAIAQRDEARAERDAYKRDYDAELAGNHELRVRHGARDDETMFQFHDRVAAELAKVTAERDELRCDYVTVCDAVAKETHGSIHAVDIATGTRAALSRVTAERDALQDQLCAVRADSAAAERELDLAHKTSEIRRQKLAAYDARDGDARLVCEWVIRVLGESSVEQDADDNDRQAAKRYLSGSPSPTATRLEEATVLLRRAMSHMTSTHADLTIDTDIDAFLGRAS